MSNCNCAKYNDLELTAKSVYIRLEETKSIKPHLKLLAENKEFHHKLMLCENCLQYWQISPAWLWNNVEHAFKVLEITPEAWIKECYLSPSKMAAYNKWVNKFVETQDPSERDLECVMEGCSKKALTLCVMCLWHHYEWMYERETKWNEKIFLPYKYEKEAHLFILTNSFS